MTSVLVVDDEPMIRLLLRQALEFDNFEVSVAKDGVDALKKVKENQPDVLVIDVMMPNMGGIAVCKALRQAPATAKLPIILLSGQAHLSKQELLRTGASCYLPKPVEIDTLVGSIRELV